MNTETMHRTANLDPFRHRMASLRTRAKTLRGYADFWSICGNATSWDTLDEAQQSAIQNILAESKASAIKSRLEEMQSHLKGICEQTQTLSLFLRDCVEEIDGELTTIGSFLDTRRHNEALSMIIALDETLIKPCESLTELVSEVIHQRTDAPYALQARVADLMCHEIFSCINSNLVKEDRTPVRAVEANPLVNFYGNGEVKARWENLRQLFLGWGKTLPISMVNRSRRCSDAVWNTQNIYRDVIGTWVAHSGIHSELTQLISARLQQAGLSASAEYIGLRGAEAISEVCATLVAGPAYTGCQVESLCQSAEEIASLSGAFQGLAPYMIWTLSITALEDLGFHMEADGYRRSIQTYYGPEEFLFSYPMYNPMLQELLSCVGTVVGTIIHSPLMSLGGRTLREILPVYSVETHDATQTFMGEILEGFGLGALQTRQAKSTATKESKSTSSKSKVQNIVPQSSMFVPVICGARLAFELVSQGGEVPAQFERQVQDKVISHCQGAIKTTMSKESSVSQDDLHRMIKSNGTGTRRRRVVTPQTA